MMCNVCLRGHLVEKEGTGTDFALLECRHCRSVFNNSEPTHEPRAVSLPPGEVLEQPTEPDVSDLSRSPLRRVITRDIPIGGDLLDVGCFDGRFLFFARQLGFRPFGLEMQAEMAEFCRKRDLQVHQGSIPHVIPADLADHKFDVVTALETIYYWEDLDACAAQIQDWLGEGGFLLLKLLQGTSSYFNGHRSYRGRVGDFKTMLNAQACEILLGRHGFRLVRCLPFACVFEPRRYQGARLLRVFYALTTKIRNLWAGTFRPPPSWDKVVLLFQKDGPPGKP